MKCAYSALCLKKCQLKYKIRYIRDWKYLSLSLSLVFEIHKIIPKFQPFLQEGYMQKRMRLIHEDSHVNPTLWHQFLFHNEMESWVQSFKRD